MKLTEETIEQELAEVLKQKLQADVVSQVRTSALKPDLLLAFNEMRIVLELKIGRPGRMLDAVTQGFGYFTELGLDGILVIIFPESVRQTILDSVDIKAIIHKVDISAIFLSSKQSKYFETTNIDSLAKWLRFAAKPQIVGIDLALLTRVLTDTVEIISAELKRQQGVARPALELVIDRFDLFSALSIGESENNREKKGDLTAVACDLASYILINQILLYTILSKPLGLPLLGNIEKSIELILYFSRVMEVDYRAVFYLEVAAHLPDSTVTQINKVIFTLKNISIDNMPHGLLGRLFHDFLPFETRKQLATFYTKPLAAELLAMLAIKKSRVVVLDPSCGSGNLLVSAYRCKKMLSDNFKHKEAIEREIYGLDIMPFATHLAALNLTIQNIHETTNYVNIGSGNALLVQHGIEIRPQVVLFPVHLKQVDLNSESGQTFVLPEKVDIVIMNPPFTRRERITESMLGDLKNEFKKPQNYWAYFLKVADIYLEKGGIIAAVLPRLFLSGSISKEVRKWLFHERNYNLLNVVKTTQEMAFSESAAFRDYLIVMSKGWTAENCAFVKLKPSIDKINFDDVVRIVYSLRSIGQGKSVSDEYIEVSWLTQYEVSNNWQNVGALFAFESSKNADTYSNFVFVLRKKDSHTTTLVNCEDVKIVRGFEPRPSKLYNYCFFVNPLAPKRIQRTIMIVHNRDERYLYVYNRLMMRKMRINIDNISPAVKTISYVPNCVINKNVDWVLTGCADKYMREITSTMNYRINSEYLKNAAEKRFAHLLVAKRINLSAAGTNFIAFYSDDKILSSNLLYSVIANIDYSAVLCVWMNSTIGILQFLANRMETGGSYGDLLLETLREDILVPTPERAALFYDEAKGFLNRIKDIRFPSIVAQLETKDEHRRELDLLALKMVGIEGRVADDWIDQLQKALLNELTALSAMMSRKKNKNDDDDGEMLDL